VHCILLALLCAGVAVLTLVRGKTKREQKLVKVCQAVMLGYTRGGRVQRSLLALLCAEGSATLVPATSARRVAVVARAAAGAAAAAEKKKRGYRVCSSGYAATDTR
jgi:hypothetical protein